jgi:hypothetical protein
MKASPVVRRYETEKLPNTLPADKRVGQLLQIDIYLSANGRRNQGQTKYLLVISRLINSSTESGRE